MTSEPRTIELIVTRSIAAPPGDVYDTWLDPQAQGSPWFGTAKAIVQPQADGLFYHTVRFENHDWAHYGRFVTLDRPSRIEHTWVSEATRGLETVVSLSFAPDGEGTLLTLRHRGVPDDEMGRRHEEGWGYVLGAIAEQFSRAAP